MTTEAPATGECPKCLEDHARVLPGFSCTVHGHGFVYVETVDGEDHDECPEPNCTQGMWTS
jgi:hypothetical protein